LTPHARFLRSKIDHISANSKQNSKRSLARESVVQGVPYCLISTVPLTMKRAVAVGTVDYSRKVASY
jgi:hypothetical protein